MTDDVVRLSGVRCFGYHGVLPEERREGQTFVVDVELHVDRSDASTTDALSATVDYAQVAKEVTDEVAGEPRQLIETLAVQIAQRLLGHARVSTVQVTVHKPDAPIDVPFADVSVTVARTR